MVSKSLPVRKLDGIARDVPEKLSVRQSPVAVFAAAGSSRIHPFLALSQAESAPKIKSRDSFFIQRIRSSLEDSKGRVDFNEMPSP